MRILPGALGLVGILEYVGIFVLVGYQPGYVYTSLTTSWPCPQQSVCRESRLFLGLHSGKCPAANLETGLSRTTVIRAFGGGVRVTGRHCAHVQNYLETNLNDANDNNIN